MVEVALLVAALTLSQGDEDGFDDEDIDSTEVSSQPGTLAYQFSQPGRANVGGGATVVTAEVALVVPTAGYYPLRVFIDNTRGPAQSVELTYISGQRGTVTVSRTVQVEPLEHRVVTLPVPVDLLYGGLKARAPGITEGGYTYVSFAHSMSNVVVLSLSSPDDFQTFAKQPPVLRGARVDVAALPIDEAPVDLAAYIGFPVVVVPGQGSVTRLSEAQLRVLEAYVASGGALVLQAPTRLPDIFSLPRRPEFGAVGFTDEAYGLGRLVVAHGALDQDVLDAAMHGGRVEAPSADDALLPQARPRGGGRFLGIIALFALLIGPGSVWVARRRGPATLLLSIPATAAFASAAIVGYAAVADGFAMHAGGISLTRLDPGQHRAITVGVTAYWANISPGVVRLPAGAVPYRSVEPPLGLNSLDMDWTDGLSLRGFFPARTYREWGMRAVQPTRARLVLRAQGDGWAIQNALGHRLAEAYVATDDGVLEARGVADGAEVRLTPSDGPPREADLGVDVPVRAVAEVLRRKLEPGEFLVKLTDAGFLPTGDVALTWEPSVHWVRGEVSR